MLDLESVDFVHSDGNEATAMLHVGRVLPAWKADEAVIRTMSGRDLAERLAPVTEIAREILSTGGSDAQDAVTELKRSWLDARQASASD
jgi:hypothetical protein